MQGTGSKYGNRATAFAGAVLCAALAAPSFGQVIISEVVDANLSGGLPKFVELTNVGCNPVDLSTYSLVNYNNGGTTATNTYPLAGVLAPGFSYVASYENGDGPGVGVFFNTYGFDPDDFTPGASINGDDTIVLFDGATIVDQLGEIGVDGTGTAWEYLDSWARRNANVLTGNAGVFNAAEWTFGGPNALDPVTQADLPTVTFPGTHTFDDPGCAPVPYACCDLFTGLCTLELAADCADPFDVWTFGETDCGAVGCTIDAGACCDTATGNCVETLTADCTGATEVFTPGMNCTQVDCTVPTGACCLTGTCVADVTAAACVASGGSYQGDDSTCDAGCPAPSGVVINEMRIDQVGNDDDEYFELSGAPGTNLDGLTYIVIGDGAGGSGTIEAVVDLTGLSLPADGHFLAVEDTFTLGGSPDLVLSSASNGLNFENSDNVTHLLVSGFTGADGDDLDTNDDGILDVAPWTSILDCVSLLEGFPGDALYCVVVVGPDGSFVPGHVLRCEDTTGNWIIGPFAPTGAQDTPGVANGCGGCCLPDATCANIDVNDCTDAGGSYLGDGEFCQNQADSDNDGSVDACDGCPADEFKTEPGQCGCGNPDTDSDGDSVADCVDNCDLIANSGQENGDADSLGDACDNCPAVDNEDQADADGDTFGDVCDNCPITTNEDQADADSDGVGNVCDNCPDNANASQTDSDGDGNGNACDICPGFDDNADADGDGVPDGCDQCPGADDGQQGATGDDDGDGVINCVDQCNGADDAVFAPGCVGAIPAASEWGLMVLALCMLVASKVAFGRSEV
ncbi:MAG: lamin tail domain-containing protein [Phycisphaerae bacterium]|nr:lamin tail domain-containing protein [Phycisphaerae bacterium]